MTGRMTSSLLVLIRWLRFYICTVVLEEIVCTRLRAMCMLPGLVTMTAVS